MGTLGGIGELGKSLTSPVALGGIGIGLVLRQTTSFSIQKP